MMKLYSETDILAIADGIRKLTGETGTYTVAQMSAAVADYWGDSALAMSGVNADGTPFTQTDEHRWGSTGLLTPNNDVELIRYCTGFIELPAGATLRVCSTGIISSFIVTTERKIPFDLNSKLGYALGNILSPEGAIGSIVYKNFSSASLWVRLNSSVPISELRMKVVSG